ncbi:MAG: hypothetical protein ACTSYI_06195 [Promethearchaeota archaeon]
MGFFRSSIKRKSTVNTIKLCPNCEKPTITRTTMGQFMNMDIYICSNCDYQGSFFIEFELPTDEQEPELNKEEDLEKKK